ncbi:MAG: ATP-binding protein [Cyclonatronaceae bacterium]
MQKTVHQHLVITTGNSNTLLKHDILCLLDNGGHILYLRPDSPADIESRVIRYHYSEVFPGAIADEIGKGLQRIGQTSHELKTCISVPTGSENEPYEITINRVLLPEPAYPLYHISIKHSSADSTGSQLLKDLLDRSPNAVMAFEPVTCSSGKVCDFRWMFANRKASDMIGKTAHDLTGTLLRGDFPVDNPSGFPAVHFDKMVRVAETGKPVEFEVSAKGVHRNRNWMYVTIQNNTSGITLTFQDITAKKQEIQKTRKLNARLRTSNIQKDKLFSIIAHDFRSPFAGCLGLLEMVLEDLDSFSTDDLRKMLEMIYNQSQSTYQLLESLLEWALTQQNRINFSPEKTDLHHIAEMTLFALNSNAENKNIRLLNRIKKGTFVHADKNMLRTILKNLLSNGIRFTKPGGVVDIWAEIKNRFIEISVTDNGIGIQKKSQKRIFDIDYQYIGKGTEGEKGTGIGLHVCREFVDRHGGSIAVDSEPGKGSTFRFTLPGSKTG